MPGTPQLFRSTGRWDQDARTWDQASDTWDGASGKPSIFRREGLAPGVLLFDDASGNFDDKEGLVDEVTS